MASSLSEKLYRGLLALYPADYRREYGPLMAQAFRDLYKSAARHEGALGVTKLWLHTVVDLSTTASSERYEEFRRTMMGQTLEKYQIEPKAGMAMLLAGVFIAGGILLNALVRQSSGSLLIGLTILIVANLLAAVVMEVVMRARGIVVLSVIILIAGHLIPMLWEPDPALWLRQNPINAMILLILSLWCKPRQMYWLMLVVAAILGLIQIGVSVLLH